MAATYRVDDPDSTREDSLMAPKIGDKWYRYYDTFLGVTTILCDTFTVKRLTPKGVWLVLDYLDNFENEESWIWTSTSTHKRKAYPTRELAWQSFVVRKTRQREHLERSLRHLKDVEMLISTGPPTPGKALQLSPEIVIDESGLFELREKE